jgi:hypothetical protein
MGANSECVFRDRNGESQSRNFIFVSVTRDAFARSPDDGASGEPHRDRRILKPGRVNQERRAGKIRFFPATTELAETAKAHQRRTS